MVQHYTASRPQQFAKCWHLKQQMYLTKFQDGPLFVSSTQQSFQSGRGVWGFWCDSKEACILWKLFFNVNATQTWQFSSTPLTDLLTFCCLCITQRPETERHLFWNCGFAQKLWSWLAHIIWVRTGSLWRPQLHHALLGNKMLREENTNLVGPSERFNDMVHLDPLECPSV
jgi:hypothetical protein